ncbi:MULTISPECIES: ABC transporter ATP-binding protein [unclassified Variovorax]|uniref:ABC transporter ATP-binding protein n=1 Tax=unclassified Variovorax TaxID=663243 RepID=UPI00076CF8B6|nr:MULTISPECIES: ABC transporter ATP-binding protein [unclassified Variovorax]KWT97956.1 Branched-chain amino acid transport ATP-binding protein LivF [Variovorax sp. WDL1]PNG59205.1 High-affinity branched-chain amino acid transport ATP-binding protein LivF [Variovorax sp. B4]PNG61004.1 High-affinity branched-chain amino acid transport ATP-binding protein LivF [Variovorax sp. B2]VTV13058.1 LIV-I protein F [Variovorax sp. WDL1]
MILSVNNLHAHYGKSHILQGVTLHVPERGIATLIGRNGAGKSTTLKAIAGSIKPTSGSVTLKTGEIAGLTADLINRRGIALVPEHRGIFSLLSVYENLQIAARPGHSGWTIARVLELFPRLGERLKNGGGELSGGEQQMLSIARALLTHPRVLMLDEPTEGLAPVVVKQLVQTFREIADSGIGILLVEQNLRVCEQVADFHHVINLGRTVFAGDGQQLRSSGAIEQHIGIGAAAAEH